MREMAITISTDQIQSWGLIGCAIIFVSGLLIWKFVRSMTGKVVSTIVILALLALAWTQRTSIEASLKACDPKVLGIHLQISDPKVRADCANTLAGIPSTG